MLKVYYANICLLKEKAVFHTIFEKVNIQRREKVLRCKNETDKLRSLMSGYLLRVALEREGMAYEDMLFSVEKNGKPVIDTKPSVHFSLSHAGDYAVCVISDQNVGVDIETKIKSFFSQEERLKSIAQKILTKEESEQFAHAAKEVKVELFLQFWTRKESYSKADGRGLGIGLEQVFTQTKEFYSQWLDKDTYLSIYAADAKFEDLQIKEICAL